MSGTIRHTLKVFSWARAQHRLRVAGGEAGFAAAAALIAKETGLSEVKVRAALAGGFSSIETQVRLACWNGLKLATKHGKPIVTVDHDAAFDGGAGVEARAVPLSPSDVKRDVDALIDRKRAEGVRL